jgi:hypothetical protein
VFFFWEFFRGLEAYECDPTAMGKVGKGIQILTGREGLGRTRCRIKKKGNKRDADVVIVRM